MWYKDIILGSSSSYMHVNVE
uniref:Uncharacterized protein n=1 Tax=Arundo donax TaxID=35708 RepID=A0A0A8XYA1_ARUDO